jgi:hypothetical protein
MPGHWLLSFLNVEQMNKKLPVLMKIVNRADPANQSLMNKHSVRLSGRIPGYPLKQGKYFIFELFVFIYRIAIFI